MPLPQKPCDASAPLRGMPRALQTLCPWLLLKTALPELHPAFVLAPALCASAATTSMDCKAETAVFPNIGKGQPEAMYAATFIESVMRAH